MRLTRRMLLLAGSTLVLVLGTIVWLLPDHTQTPGHHPVSATVAKPSEREAVQQTASVPVDIAVNVAPDATIRDMVNKGLPIPSRPRQYVLDSGNQSLEDCVKDLGNRFTLAMGPVHALGDFDSLPSWISITYHAKVLRVIEEGRKAPDQVIPLVLAEIHRDSAFSLAELETRYRDTVLREPFEPVFTRDDDPKYNESREYGNVAGEYPRRMDAIGQCFYALANLNALAQARNELAAFAQMKLQARPLSFSVVLISCLVNELQKQGQPVDAELVAATKKIQLGLAARSAWNAPVDIHDPMVKIVNLNTSFVRTLQVIAIPGNMNLPPDEQEQIVDRFAAFVKKSA